MRIRHLGCIAGVGAVIAASALLTGAAGAATATSAANIIRNGSFEQPAVAAGSYVLFGTGQSFAGWRVVGAAGNVAPISGAFTQSGLAFPAREGRQWLDLTGTSNSATGVAQVVRLQPGASYVLTFWIGNLVNPGGIFGSASTVDVAVNGKPVLRGVNAGGAGRPAQVWKKLGVTFTAAKAATTISFLNHDPAADNHNGLDGVQLTRRS